MGIINDVNLSQFFWLRAKIETRQLDGNKIKTPNKTMQRIFTSPAYSAGQVKIADF